MKRREWSRFQHLPQGPRAVRAVALPGPNGDSLGLRLGSWLLRVLRECAYLLLCSWCIRELLD
uniref:Lens epithelial cell protein LEP503 n=1 Tax=Anas zonorhyncha TaxID=75864 RepID=A0A8B9W317_9AVES